MSAAWAMADPADGGLGLTVAGEKLCLRPSGALWLERRSVLVVADLHLEKGSAYALRGQMLPPYDSDDTLGRLEAEVAAVRPRTIIFLGDSFHDRRAEGRLRAAGRRRLERLAESRDLVWVLGNHDPAGPETIAGEAVARYGVGGLVFSHAPEANDGEGSVAGHLHPCAKVVGRGGGIRRRCFVTDGRRVILPAFGAYAGGLNVRDAAFAPLLGRIKLAAVLGRGRIYPVGWPSLRAD